MWVLHDKIFFSIIAKDNAVYRPNINQRGITVKVRIGTPNFFICTVTKTSLFSYKNLCNVRSIVVLSLILTVYPARISVSQTDLCANVT